MTSGTPYSPLKICEGATKLHRYYYLGTATKVSSRLMPMHIEPIITQAFPISASNLNTKAKIIPPKLPIEPTNPVVIP